MASTAVISPFLHRSVTSRKFGGVIGFRPVYFPAFFAIAMPSRWRCRMYSRSNSATAPNTVSMNFPVGVVVSMASFLLTNSTPFAVSCSTNSSMADSFATDRERMEQQIKEADHRLDELESQMLAGDQRKELIQRYTNVEHLTREMVEILIDYISVGKRIPGTHEVPIEIHWNF